MTTLFPPAFTPPAPSGPMSLLPTPGGIAGLGTNPLSPLARGLAGGVTPLAPLPVMGGGLAAQVPAGVGAEALTAANALRGGGGGLGGLASQAARSAGPLVPKGAAMRGSLYGLAGSLGSGLIDKTDIGGQNSNLEQGLQGAAQGAGLGAGLGLLGGPFAGLTVPGGAAIGGAVGGAIGVLGNMFGGGGGGEEEEATPTKILANAINAAQLDPAATEEILTTYETLMALAESAPEGDEREAARAMALDQAGQLVLQALQTRDESAAQATNALALQAQAGQIFEPLAQDIESSSLMYADAMKGIRPSLPAEYQAIADSQVARELTSADKLANAYRAQAQITPIVNQMTQYQQDNANYAAQMFAQALAQQAAGGGMGGQPSTQDVLAQLQPTG